MIFGLDDFDLIVDFLQLNKILHLPRFAWVVGNSRIAVLGFLDLARIV
jgi:hypothetical protein